ncbi:type I restriction endonuclease [Neolewinella sp.]|uniref:type I restriction endonuclease n=1 Tax=Neolewinella sp. TaxID=2993543 RepID=UPI003B52EEA2
MAHNFSEDGLVESALQECLEELGWTVLTAWKKETFGPDGLLGRANKGEVVLTRYLLQALQRLNPDRPATAYGEGARTLVQGSSVKEPGRVNQEKQRTLRENPLRLELYDHYREIIERYNAGKDQSALEEVFGELTELIKAMGEEESRYVREGLTGEEALAIFDLLREGKQLTNGQKRDVLSVDRWRESHQVSAGVRTTIHDRLLYLPPAVYTDAEVSERLGVVYQHVWSRYGGGERTNITPP